MNLTTAFAVATWWTLIYQLQKLRLAAIARASSKLSGEGPFHVSRHAVHGAFLKAVTQLDLLHLNHSVYHSILDLSWRLRSIAVALANWRHRRDYSAPDSCLVDLVYCDASYLIVFH